MEMTVIKEAINAMRNGGFDCMPIPEYRDKDYKFDPETELVVTKAGCSLKWFNTFKGGCWHVLPSMS